MDNQNKNLILATALSMLVILVWFQFFPPPELTIEEPIAETGGTIETADGASVPIVDTETGMIVDAGVAPAETPSIADAPRVAIETARLSGSISLLGGRIDDLALKDYPIELGSTEVVNILSPVGSENAYYALYGWAAANGVAQENVPGGETIWSLETGETLTTDNPISLIWDNGAGLVFRKMISVDENYLFTIAQSVENNSEAEVSLAPYGFIAQHGEPDLVGFFILHEGLVRMTDGELQEIDYDDMTDLEFDARRNANTETLSVEQNGWIGFTTDKYWMTNILPTPGTSFRSSATYNPRSDIYQAEAVMPVQVVAAGATAEVQTQLFAGAKEWETIRTYQNENGIEGFVDSIDWGWFFFLTKPIFAVLHWLNTIIGNMGWSIIVLTLLIKAILLPLAYKSYVSMARMKELQPQMEKLKEEAGDDREKMQKGMMALYKTNKVNPASGCLPILMQIPIFFSLYKVIFVTIELRHAAWLGWIKDLSAPDPSSILNLFGILPITPPDPSSIFAIVSLGILPIILGISMWMQQKLNPAPTDPTQKMIFAWMPWVFMFMLGSFASGLVLYWIANNTITFTQQYLIMRSQGIKPDVFGNIKGSLKRASKTDAD